MRGSSICCQKRGSLSNAYKDTRSGLEFRLDKNCEDSGEGCHSLSKSSCDFLGTISSIWGARSGYVSTTLFRIAR